ncbi:MAG: 6-phosphogluconolactonase [Acidobacteria bacterium]|nr:6-phosphogluconolactonase [Acidobacteriota bacterium]
MTAQVRIFNSAAELFQGAAETICRVGLQAIRERGKYTIALSGGSTPRGLHQELVTSFRSQIPWDKVFFFWGDERHVPPDFPESNYRMARETLLSQLPISEDHVFRMRGEMADAEIAARAYEELLRDFFRPLPGEFPRLDFILLGMGSDGHTASLFPGTNALLEKERLAVANWVEQHSTFRLTLTYPVLNHALNVMFLIRDGNKADLVMRALKEPDAHLPCQGVQPVHGELMWYLDRAAGQRL